MQAGRVAVLLALCAPLVFAADPCPSKVCEAYFGNAVGGPIDCCYWDYGKNPKCQWGGTPVSWTRPGTCVENGKTFNVLYKGNFQGDPNAKEYCKCKNDIPSVSGPSSITVCATLKARFGTDIKGNDLACDNLIYCKKCGGVDAVAKACGAVAKCAAFVMEDGTSCGYLK
eukprot:gene8287-8474_t